MIEEATKEGIIKYLNEEISYLEKRFDSFKGFKWNGLANTIETELLMMKAIRRLIENQPPIKKSLMKLAEDLGVSFSAAKIISDHAQPEVDGEFIERWQSILECSHKSRIDKIRQMLKEIPVRVKEKERI